MAQFLSDTWFDEVEKIKADVGEIPTPPALEGLIINVAVTGHPEGDKEIKTTGGMFEKGFDDSADTKLILPYDIAVKMFVERDQQAGMQAFMSGQIQVEGDMSKVMMMQNAGAPSDEMKTFGKAVSAMTDA